MIKSIEISNFKSIKSIELKDCRRINLLIGRPNVGKSNILESLALFDVPYMSMTSSRSLKHLVRVENVADLFHYGDSSCPIEIKADTERLTAFRTPSNGLGIALSTAYEDVKYLFSTSLTLTTKKEPAVFPDILAYFYQKNVKPEASGYNFLLPPSGSNLMEIVASLPRLRNQLSEIFHGYGLKMMFDSGSQEIKAMRENGLDMFLVSFNSLADSLQRLIFYKAAIESNTDKVICLEEPEAHTFPPYITNVVESILSSETNQYFITTHSPYVINTLLESGRDSVAVYVVGIENQSTTLKRLSESELQDIYDDGIDVFYNIDAFLSI